ncbi:hypothetical protein CV_2122 [Chromobacterium violaceum ATCC 12472]|uniref:Uncharacterized protein n=1 Tax=Chromobacterium violaceum (strain ATCC 12472 / DSM 30191 / JCM 1249 / CCUG 213 / NBRC 12614 / NCIMB 9131 / NCTC 9757 / MK) TaxID=243365 RepID=Q7NW68_CHRVO|nr:hypothetical protein [Chromobacterium violaceum]AAQ59795.1 hypothetical protein CV_2122 [Chromobacterium violaceum ATCC 12472]
MFEKTALTTAKAIYWLVICSGAIWLAWVCFANLPLWAAVILFAIVLPLAAMAGAPLAAGASFAAGVLVAAVLAAYRRATHSGA